MRLRPASLIVFTVALALPVAAQQEPVAVPIDKASYHWPVFKNEYVTLLRVMFPPGRGSNYHTHSTDQLGVVIETGGNSNQLLGEAPTPPRAATPGNVGF